MRRTLRRWAGKSFRLLEYFLKSSILKCLRALTIKSNSNITLTFDAHSAVDGTGAQLQRYITIYALSRYFGFKFLTSDIKQISIHALDPFQTQRLYSDYLQELNQFLQFKGNGVTSVATQESKQKTITFLNFCVLLVKNLFNRDELSFGVLEPYEVSEFCPEIMTGIQDNLSIRLGSHSAHTDTSIVLHYRQGVGGFALYPGQNIPRETPLESYARTIENILSSIKSKNRPHILVLTDAPDEVTYFVPPRDQQILWEGTPGFENGRMTIKPIDFNMLKQRSGLEVSVIRGGNPLEAIKAMATADYLLMSKSSLSYVGAILNTDGNVYYPVEFWHRPLSNWKVLEG
jgi:hypothetical protein